MEFRDPIHGFVYFNDLEADVINSAPFQRLRRIKQLALTDYVYPAASHSRFEHSLGVMHLASRIFDRLVEDKRSKEILSSEFGIKDESYPRFRQIVRLFVKGFGGDIPVRMRTSSGAGTKPLSKISTVPQYLRGFNHIRFYAPMGSRDSAAQACSSISASASRKTGS